MSTPRNEPLSPCLGSPYCMTDPEGVCPTSHHPDCPRSRLHEKRTNYEVRAHVDAALRQVERAAGSEPVPAPALSDDELRAIADEARSFDRELVWRSAHTALCVLRESARAYAEGIIAERKRSRDVHALAVRLADEMQRDLSWLTSYKGGGALPAYNRQLVLLDECRAAGLLAGEEQR